MTSDGSRSGVNWMRLIVPPVARASAFASIVLPTPGTSSIRRWPPASITANAERMTSFLPSITVPTAAMTCSAASRTSSAPRESKVIPSVMAPSVLPKTVHHKREVRTDRAERPDSPGVRRTGGASGSLS